MEDNVRKRMYACIGVTLLYSRKLTEHCKPAILEKIKIIILKKRLMKHAYGKIYFLETRAEKNVIPSLFISIYLLL